MLSKEQLEEYRKMTPGERIALSLEMTAWNWEYLFKGSDDLVNRRFALLDRENNLRNRNMLRAISRSRANDGQR